MSRDNNARDPYVGLNRHISQRSRGEYRPAYTVGTVVSLYPIQIRADGLDLDENDVRVPESMYLNFLEARPGGAAPDEPRGMRTRLPEAHFICRCAVSVGVAVRPEEYVSGAPVLDAGDEVLLMRSDDGQTYYLLERMVQLESVSDDQPAGGD